MPRTLLVSVLLLAACDDDYLLPGQELGDVRIDAILALTPSETDGEAAFSTYCQGCHYPDGAEGPVGPSLAAWMAAAEDSATLKVMLEGRAAMPAINLTDREAADILGWMTATFAGGGPSDTDPAQTDDAALGLTGDIDRGAQLYLDHCERCHSTDGSRGPIGPAMSEWFPSHPPAETLALIRNGQGTMPSFNNLTDQDLADILAWTYDTFGN